MVTIIAGEYRSRKLMTIPNDLASRPLLSRVKESVFGMLHGWLDGARVLDLFAGVGPVGLEAVSRGALAVLMVEADPRIFRVLEANISRLGCQDRARALLADARGATCLADAPSPVDLVFVDPPYAMMAREPSRGEILDLIARCRAIMGGGGFVVLRSPLGPEEVKLAVAGFRGPESHRYRKDMWVLLYEPLSPPPEPGTVEE